MGVNTDRGYTLHEHLDEVGVIHVNGRVYDPLIGRFMSADPFVQSPGNLQSYNRYAYVMNNPLVFTDPSGYISLKSAFKRTVRLPMLCSAQRNALEVISLATGGRSRRAIPLLVIITHERLSVSGR